MIPLVRRGPVVVLAVVLLAPSCAFAQESDFDGEEDHADAVDAVEHVDHAPAGGAIDVPQPVDAPPAPVQNFGDIPNSGTVAPQAATPAPNAAPGAPNPTPSPTANAVPNPAVTPPTAPPTAANPRQHTPPAPPMPPGSPPQPGGNGAAKVLGRSFPSPVQPPAPAEAPEVHVTIVPRSEPSVGKNRLRGDATSPSSNAGGGSDAPTAGVTPDSGGD